MLKRLALHGVWLSIALAGSARGDLVVTLVARDAAGDPLGASVAAGTEAVVDVLLSVTAEDDPLEDVRGIQFDFTLTPAAIDLDSFTWSIDLTGYGFSNSSLPVPFAVSFLQSSSPMLLTLNETQTLVARVNIVVNASSTLNAVGGTGPGEGSNARIDGDFENPKLFSLANENLTGGTLAFTVPGSPLPEDDADGDGVADADDAFPNDPDEWVDSDDDGIGDNADPDDDGDGVNDDVDAFPDDPNESADTDGDGVGDNADAFPDDPDETVDTDGNGVGDNSDPDDDGDGVDDGDDAFPKDPTEQSDSDGDGIGDNAEGDSNMGPRVGGLCGAAMVGPLFLTGLALSLVRVRRRRARRLDDRRSYPARM